MRARIGYLSCFQFTLLCTELAAPCSFGICILLHTAFEFVQLAPPLIQRLAYLAQLVGVPSLCFLGTLLKVELDLAQRLQSADEVVVEDTKIRVWLRLRLTTFLL